MSIICDHCDRVTELEQENALLEAELKKRDGERTRSLFSYGDLAELVLRSAPENVRMELMGEPKLL
jgi:hypothetical protein